MPSLVTTFIQPIDRDMARLRRLFVIHSSIKAMSGRGLG